jgi:hypothetical protein
MRYVLLLLLPLLTGGCLAGASALAESGEDIDYYLKTNDVEPEIQEAMESRKIIGGMTPEQVRLVMGDHPDYDTRPEGKEKAEAGEVWVYDNNDPMKTVSYRITFKDKVVVAAEEK